MVLQGKPDEEKTWSIPSGGMKVGESPEKCCERELFEETGYRVNILKKLCVKRTYTEHIQVIVHYFWAEVIGGKSVIQDPDELIHQGTGRRKMKRKR